MLSDRDIQQLRNDNLDNVADEIEMLRDKAAGWQPIETAPEDVYIDVWVKSRENSSYGKRVCNVFKLNNKWFGATRPDEWHSEYAAFWMPLPKPPSDV